MLRRFAMFSSRLPPFPAQGSGKCESAPCFLRFKLPGGFNTGELAYGKVVCRSPAVAELPGGGT